MTPIFQNIHKLQPHKVDYFMFKQGHNSSYLSVVFILLYILAIVLFINADFLKQKFSNNNNNNLCLLMF